MKRASGKTSQEKELRWYHRIGKEAVHGASTAELVAKYKLAKRKLTGDYARKAKQFAKQFKRAGLENCFPANPGAGKILTWSHIRLLVSVQVSVIRRKLVKRAVAESWSRDRLQQEILIATEEKPGRRLGRRATPPESHEQALMELRTRSEQWLEYWEASKEALDQLNNKSSLKATSGPEPASKKPRSRLTVEQMQSMRAVFEAHRSALSHLLSILAQLDAEYLAAARAKSRRKRS